MAHDEWQPDVDVHSPDRSVRLRADHAGQARVDLCDLHRHTEESLAGQVRAAARVALAALQAEPVVRRDGDRW
ncbi:hypothetical protein ACTI_73940 [Actinoplanes sp. OR16]|uniref:hypothetical protein n=1 Tax=Actinoplanes sp. OR16 TaxID=946334 RepID=UPI000F6C82A6|nr:hypothetical protein [Actinoplanes sp. OR16]BBH70709.1 hypothetical protein ACTI_73940 [Actinoplanes sp. OR16]